MFKHSTKKQQRGNGVTAAAARRAAAGTGTATLHACAHLAVGIPLLLHAVHERLLPVPQLLFPASAHTSGQCSMSSC